VLSVALTQDGQRIVTGGGDGTRVLDAVSGREFFHLQEPSGAALSVAITPDGRRLVTGGWDGTPRVWDGVSGRQLLRLEGHADRDGSAPVASDRLRIWSLAITPDGRRIVAGNEDGTVRVWDGITSRELLKINAHFGRVVSVAVTPDGQRLATSGDPAKLWDAVSGRLLLELKGQTSGASSVAFTPGGQQIITGADGTITFWDAISGRELLSFKGHNGAVSSIAVTRDGKRIVTCGADRTARVWDTVSGRELLSLKGHNRPVRSVVMIPDGQRIVTGSEDGTVKIWEAASQEQVALWTNQDQADPLPPPAWVRPVAGAPGFIQDWLVLAPLPLTEDQGWAEALEHEPFAGEARLQPRAGDRVRGKAREWTWQAYHAGAPVLDFNRLLGQLTNHSVAYAACYVISEKERHDLLLQLGSDDQAKVYLNGQEVYKHILPRGLHALDPVGPVTLRKGTNVLVLKVVNEGMNWEGCARFLDREGNSAKGLRISLTPEN
jgi:hypothetical protein